MQRYAKKAKLRTKTQKKQRKRYLYSQIDRGLQLCNKLSQGCTGVVGSHEMLSHEESSVTDTSQHFDGFRVGDTALADLHGVFWQA